MSDQNTAQGEQGSREAAAAVADVRTFVLGVKSAIAAAVLFLGLCVTLYGFGSAWGELRRQTRDQDARILKLEADARLTRSELQEARRTLSEIRGALKPSRIRD